MTPRDPSDELIGHVHVLVKGVRADAPHAIAWEPVYRKADGRWYAHMPGREFGRRHVGGWQFKVLHSTFQPL